MYMKNNKRRERDEVKTTPTKVVSSLASDEFTSPSTPTHSSASVKWDDTQSIMNDLLEFYQSSHQEDIDISKINYLLNEISNTKEENKHKANEIKTKYNNQITTFEKQVKIEKDDLNKQEQYLTYLQKEVNGLKSEKEKLIRQKNESLQRIEEYEIEASEVVEKQDEIETQMKELNAKMKQHITNYATLTGIKWNFDSKNHMEGEFNIPSKNEVRRFKVGPIEEYDDVELANKLWETLDMNVDISNYMR